MSNRKYLKVESRSDGIRIIQFNRPDAMNAWNLEMREEVIAEIEALPLSEVRAVIFAGTERAFGAGEDVRGMEDLSKGGTKKFRAWARSMHLHFDMIEALEVPVIAAIEGTAAGGGLELALSCDFRVVSRQARLGLPEKNVGLIPGSGGCSRLVRLIGLARAKELVMLENMISAERANELGLVTRLVDNGKALDEAIAVAEQLVQRSPLALGLAKLVLNTCGDVDLETGRRIERLGQSVLKMTDDHIEAVNAFIGKRKPHWKAM
ncbi:MAG: enoyl-CoA hydratase/isomerase family protein [Alphaproteobacteria bacterium]